MQRIRVLHLGNEPIEFILSCRKLKCLKLLNRKKGPLFFYINSGKPETSCEMEKKGALFFYINSGKLETTLTLTLYYTRLDYTILYFLYRDI